MQASSSTTAPAAATLSWTEWRLIGLLMGACFLGHFNRNAIVAAADLQIMRQYAIAPERMGLVYSAFLLFYTLLMVPGGWLVDRRGPKFALTVVCAGSAVFIVLTAATGLATSGSTVLALLIVVRSAMGVVNAPLHPAAANAVSLGIPHTRRSGANGLVTGAALVGVASSFVVFGTLVDRFDWPGAFLISAAVTAALAWLWLRYGAAGTDAAPRAPTTAAPHAAAPATERARWQRKSLVLLTCSYAAIGYFQYLFFYWVHYYFLEELALGAEASRFYAGIPPLAMAAGMPLGGWLSDRLQAAWGWRVGRAGLVVASMTAAALLLWIGVRAADPMWVVAWLSLALGVLGMAEGPFWLTAVEVGGRRGGLSAGIFNTGGNLGGVIVPVATPLLSRTLGFGWENSISVASVVCLAGACCWIWIDPVNPVADRPQADAPAVGAEPVNL